MDDKQLFLNSISAARQQHEEKVLLEQKRKKDVAVLAEAMKKFYPGPTPEELEVQEQRKKDIAALEAHLLKQETIITEEQSQTLHEALIESMDEVVPPILIEEEPPAIPLGAQPLPQLPEKDIITKSVELLAKTPRDEYVNKADSIPNSIRKELDLMKKTLTDLHRFARNTSGVVSGGGAGDITELTHRAISVTGNYTANRKDYYIGVNCPGPCTIALPTLGVKTGRILVVKDESGNCSINHITVVADDGGTIDNDTTVTMGINNMSLQFIYRDGWRII